MSKTGAAKSKLLYGVHPAVAMVQKWEAGLKSNTGRSREEWLALVKKEGPKEKLRPIYDELLALGLSQGPDAKACPCKTIVPLYRNHVFAQIKPTTNSRIDLGSLSPTSKESFPRASLTLAAPRRRIASLIASN